MTVEEDWQRKNFPTTELAEAFRDGLTYGDEPEWEVDVIEPCRYGGFDVVFTRPYDEADPADAVGTSMASHEH